MGETLRGGIVGCGYFGRIQLEAWSRIPDAEIVAACDQDIERARAAAPAAYADAGEMIERESLDFLDIATRPNSHLPLVRLAVEHRLPVICQKPMAPGWDEAVAMVEAAEQAGVPLVIHENWRWQPWYREAHRRIEAGETGRPLAYSFEIRQRDGLGEHPYPNQPYFAEMPRLLIYEMLVHQIDTARFLLGDIESVVARARRINPRILGEDQATLILTHAGGLQGVIDGNRVANPVPPGPAMGAARIDGEDASLTIPATGELFLDGRKVWTPPETAGYRGDCVRAVQAHFVNALRTGAPAKNTGREYLKTFAVVEAAYESIATNKGVRLDQWL